MNRKKNQLDNNEMLTEENRLDLIEHFIEQDITWEIAEYKPGVMASIEGYTGNPYVDTLQKPLTHSEIIESCGYYPKIPTQKTRQLSPEDRKERCSKIYELNIPFSRSTRFGQRFLKKIKSSYLIESDPVKAQREKHLSKMARKIANQKRRRGKSKKSHFGLFGSPGVGKTTLLHETVSLLTQVIFHSSGSYLDYDLPLKTQLTYIMVECPFDASRTAWADSFFHELDRILCPGSLENPQKRFYYRAYAHNKNQPEKLKNIEFLCKQLNIGCIIIDEVQRAGLRYQNAGRIVGMWNQVMDEVGTLIVFSGTGQALPVLVPNTYTTRRIELPPDGLWYRLAKDSQDWNTLMDTLGLYQYLHNKFEMTEEIKKALYRYSQGVIALTMRLFVRSLVYTIDITGHDEDKNKKTWEENLTPEIIEAVAEHEFKLLKSGIDALNAFEPGSTHEKAAVRLFNDLLEAHWDSICEFDKDNMWSQSGFSSNGSPSAPANSSPKAPASKPTSKTNKLKRAKRPKLDEWETLEVTDLRHHVYKNWLADETPAYQSILENTDHILPFSEFWSQEQELES